MKESLRVVRSREPRLMQAAILLLASGLTTIVTAILGPSLPRMQAHFAAVRGADYLVPLTLTAPMLMMALVSIVAGILADRVGRKLLLVASTTAYAIVGTAPLWVGSLDAIFVSRLLLGITVATLMTVSTTMIGDYYHGHVRDRYVALQTTMAAGSGLVFSLLGGALGEYGWRAPYAGFALSLPLAILMARHLWEPAREEAGNSAVTTIESGALQPSQLTATCAAGFLAGLIFLIAPVHLGYLFAALGVNAPSTVGIAAALNSLGVVCGTLCFGWGAVRRLPVCGQLAVSIGLSGVGFAGMGEAATAVTLTLGAILNGFGAGLLLPAAVTWNMSGLSFAKRGFGVGAFQSCLFLGMFTNPFVVVSLEKVVGTRAQAVLVVGACLLLAAALLALVFSLRSRAADAAPR